jgi:hypothetical protein
LAIKTGSEFRTHQNGNGPGRVRVRARNDDYKISYYRTSDSIKISWRRHSTTPLAKVRAEVEVKASEKQQGRGNGMKNNHRMTDRIMDDTDEVKNLRRICRESKENKYPPQTVKNYFEHLRQYIEIEPSVNLNAGEGVMTRGRRFIKDEIIGVYEGDVVKERDGEYILMMKREGAANVWIDADPKLGDRVSLFGKMNEDLHTVRYNAEIGEDGFIRILEDTEDEELFTRYWKTNYDWDDLKQRTLISLVEEIEETFPGLAGLIPRSWKLLKVDKLHLNKWIKKLIEGKTSPIELHGIMGWKTDGYTIEDLICFLTYGPNSVKYNYKHWGQENKEWKVLDPKEKLVANYTKKWDGLDTIKTDLSVLSDINEGNPIISGLIKMTKKTKKSTKVKLSKPPKVEARSGRIRVTMKLRENKLKKEMRQINQCTDRGTLKELLKGMDIWRVAVKEERGENKIPAAGWCGYLAIDQIIRGQDGPTHLSDPGGAEKIRESVEEVYLAGNGQVRKNWMKTKKYCHLSPREVLLSVKGTLANWTNRLTDGLETARWMNSKNLYGTCEKWRYSLWGEDELDPEFCELRDSPKSLGSVTHHQEWEWILENSMLIGRNSHYYVRKGGLNQDFQAAFEIALEEAVERIADGMGLGGTTNQILTEIIENTSDEGEQSQAELVEIDMGGSTTGDDEIGHSNHDLNDDEPR